MSQVSPPPLLHLPARPARLQRCFPQSLRVFHLWAVRQHPLLPIWWKADPEDILKHPQQMWLRCMEDAGSHDKMLCNAEKDFRVSEKVTSTCSARGGLGSKLGALIHFLVLVEGACQGWSNLCFKCCIHFYFLLFKYWKRDSGVLEFGNQHCTTEWEVFFMASSGRIWGIN